MDREAVTSELTRIIGAYLKEKGLELVELIYRYEGRDPALRILADKPEGGITLDECAYLNQDIVNLLDEKGVLQNRYILEVSSPGLDRSLKTKNDFLRSLNKELKVFLNEPIRNKLEWDGFLLKVEGEVLYLGVSKETLEIPLAKINKAKQII